MNTLILLLAFTDPGTDLPVAADDGKPASVEEAARMEAFKAVKARLEAKDAYLAASRGDMERENALRESRKKADRAGALKVSGGKQTHAHQYVPVKERAKILYDKHHPKK